MVGTIAKNEIYGDVIYCELPYYSLGSRILHRLALGSKAIAQVSFDIESLLKKAESRYEGPHVFIAGLARAGTTILLRALYHTGKFRSLTYRDMPFVLMPSLWAQLSTPFRKHQAESERAHGDRILVNFDSPEAFEEVFWRVFCGSEYIASDRLKPHSVDDDTIALFRRYIDQILASDREKRNRYLSKNNNNILRLPALTHAFPKAVIVIPFRDPIQQAISLLRQHVKFSARHATDRFSYKYTIWLGHHEFGLTHKPVDWGLDSHMPGARHTPDDINYWLQIWCRTYQYLVQTAPEGATFLSYESLCESGTVHIQRILDAAQLNMPDEPYDFPFAVAENRSMNGINDDLAAETLALYRQLLERST